MITTGSWNSHNGKAFQKAILDHIQNQVTQVIHGTYRGSISGTHHYNPESGLWVFVDHQGNFITGWKLSPEQLEYLQLTGNIQ